MGNLIQWAFKDAATQKRLFISIASVVILVVVQNIPLPGIQVQNFSPVASQFFPPLHFSLFLLGIAPCHKRCA